MKLTSYGAALEVTGSQHLLEINGKKILLDCGLFQGRREEAFEKSRTFKYNPAEVDCLILSHAHIDHCGNIPHLVKEGFKGVIYSTRATKELSSIMLMDSANIQASDAEYFTKRHSDSLVKMEPLYTTGDAEYSMKFFKTLHLEETFKLYDGIELTFYEAGHVLGSAMVALDIKDEDDGKKKRFLFTGDIGRCNMPILNDPYQVKKADYLLTESTYGNRTHLPIEEGMPELARIINRTIRRGGKIFIPSFAFERTQELIYGLSVLIDKKEIPSNLPIFLDSPLATEITAIFQTHNELYDEQIRNYFKLNHNPFKPKQLKHIKTVEESKDLNNFLGPCIVIAASGMCEAGRIRHHLKNNIEDPKNTIAIVGYMAEHTLGRKLVDGEPAVKIFSEIYKVNAEVVVLESFSAHADMNDLDTYVKNIKGLKQVMLVHGEQAQSEPMAERLKKKFKVKTVILKPEETIEF